MLSYFFEHFQSSIFDWYFIPLKLYLLIKGLMFDSLCGSLLNFWRILETFIICIFGIYCWFFLFYPVWRINKWSPKLKIDLYIYNTAELNQKLNYSISLMFLDQFGSWIKWLKKFIENFICIIIWQIFYIVALRVNYMLFIKIFRRNKVNCNC